ncbi:hypothetical protein BDZ45DRAFT_735523 [Acephala macrosclerotiorum]|nr:hypothetical protein BDZ45DRAFT_735523 [Acephala macrosclerotiorum]
MEASKSKMDSRPIPYAECNHGDATTECHSVQKNYRKASWHDQWIYEYDIGVSEEWFGKKKDSETVSMGKDKKLYGHVRIRKKVMYIRHPPGNIYAGRLRAIERWQIHMDVDPSIWRDCQRYKSGEKVHWVYLEHRRASEEPLKRCWDWRNIWAPTS